MTFRSCLVSTRVVSGGSAGWPSVPASCWWGTGEQSHRDDSCNTLSEQPCRLYPDVDSFSRLTSAQFIIISFLAFPPEVRLFNYHYPPWTTVLGYCIGVSSFICVPAYMVFYLLNAKGTFKQVQHCLSHSLTVIPFFGGLFLFIYLFIFLNSLSPIPAVFYLSPL